MRAPAKPIPAARPSFARVALSGLYKNRRAYRALAAGVFLSIFFVSTMGLSLYSLLRGSEARYRAEKKRLRKERNTITCTVGLSLNQTGFDNWAARRP